jgi:SAM-dependent methyltransferase
MIWRAKIAAKLLLSRLPVPYGLWRQLKVFRHGTMDVPDYAWGTFRRHFGEADFPRKTDGFVALELGPGDSVASALVAAAHGAEHTYLVDVGDFATRDMAVYAGIADYLDGVGIERRIPGGVDFDQMLRLCKADYLTEGVRSLRTIPDASVDFIWSQAVLEHIRLHEFDALTSELRRVLRPDGICSHTVDLRDHLGGALNNLRFRREVWESPFFADAGFYTNRIRYSEMLDRFRRAGFRIMSARELRWSELPTPVEKMDSKYGSVPPEDLLVYGFDVVLRRSA